MSPFQKMVIPPPMSAHTITMKSPVNQVSFGAGLHKHNMMVKCSKNLAYIKYDQSSPSYQSCDVILEDNSSDIDALGQIALLSGDFVASLLCNEEDTQLELFKFNQDTLKLEKRFILSLKFIDDFTDEIGYEINFFILANRKHLYCKIGSKVKFLVGEFS